MMLPPDTPLQWVPVPPLSPLAQRLIEESNRPEGHMHSNISMDAQRGVAPRQLSEADHLANAVNEETGAWFEERRVELNTVAQQIAQVEHDRDRLTETLSTLNARRHALIAALETESDSPKPLATPAMAAPSPGGPAIAARD